MIAVQLVAQAGDGKAGGGDGKDAGGFFSSPIPLLIAMVFMFYLLVLRPNKRQEKERQALVDAFKKNDEVVTASGIIGTVISVKKDKDEVILESSNSRLRVLRSSIARVLSKEDKGEGATKDGEESTDERTEKKDWRQPVRSHIVPEKNGTQGSGERPRTVRWPHRNLPCFRRSITPIATVAYSFDAAHECAVLAPLSTSLRFRPGRAPAPGRRPGRLHPRCPPKA